MHFPTKKRIWSLVAAILSLNGAKNNPKKLQKSRRSGQRGGGLAQAPPKYATVLHASGDLFC